MFLDDVFDVDLTGHKFFLMKGKLSSKKILDKNLCFWKSTTMD